MNKNHRLSTVTSLQVGVDYQVHITIYAYYRGTDAQGYSIPCAKMHMQIHFKIELRSKTDKKSYFSIYKVWSPCFLPSIFFLHFIRTSCHLHSSSIMRAITGDLGRMQEEWGLSLGFATEVSTLAFLQYTVAESPSWWNKDFALQLTLSQQEKPTKRHGSSSAFCLFCRKQTDGSIKEAAPCTQGEIAVRFVTFK